MKSRLRLFTMVGLIAGCVAAYAQETPPPANPMDGAPAAEQAAPPPALEQTAADPAPAAEPAAPPAAPPIVNEAAPAASAPALDAGSADMVIPLIVMDDVPLTDAIKNLARQAGLNYMLDPKVTFGQPGPDGRPVPQPMVSIRWENVTAGQALSALLNNYNLQLVEDPKSKIARIMVKDPAAPDPLVTDIIQLKYAMPSNIVIAVQSTLTDKRSKVVADVRTSQLVILATEKELADARTMIEKLDTPTKQVLIEARLLETSINPETRKGVDWAGTLERQNVSWGNNRQFNPVPDDSEHAPLAGLNADKPWPKFITDLTGRGLSTHTAFLNADGVNAVISFLNKYGEAKVISSPRTVTLDNEPARIEVTRASPIINITPGTVQVSGGSQITYTNLGVILNVTPRISANNYVNLKVSPEVSRNAGTVTKVVNNGIFEVDEYDLRKMETRVMIPSGNTLVLGGLVQDDIRKGNSKVPVLGDIPVLGGLFRSDSKSRQKSNLMVFLTPTIVQDEDFQPTESKYLKTPAPKSDEVEPDWSAWDSGQSAKQIKAEKAAAGGNFEEVPQ
ncbi:MAG TPA: secretin N-terminal domain-containing protein [Verrucomicrobiota bacterium]|nr:secretin N-terminal domain-containing protein [Verrucomicrobiota bacterium]HRT07024.1 secretin N-terminal domain-containing protein [Candidatus Paceibacterota bacterium]HRT55517.1 secretin N-terminal domain-containing protein [Candidatus Paceibacterota bacterium]